MERTPLTPLELALIAELRAVAGLARQGELAVDQGRAVNGRSMLAKVRERAEDAARHGTAGTLVPAVRTAA